MQSASLFSGRGRSGSSSSEEGEAAAQSSPTMDVEQTEPPQLDIVSARYEPLRGSQPWKMRFVTEQLKERIIQKGGGTHLRMKREFNRYFGDPCPGEPKQLVIIFSVKGKEHIMKWVEGSIVNVTAESLLNKSSRSARESPQRRMARVPNKVQKDTFPHAALPVIMSFLPVYPDRLMCQLVCKEWAVSMSSNGLTEEFRIGAHDIPGPCYQDQPPAFVELIVRKSKNSLKVLNLDGYSLLEDRVASMLFRSATRLTHLDLTDCTQLHDDSIMCVATSCPHLIVLTLKRVTHLTDASLVPIAAGCLLLERLDIGGLKLLTDDTLEAIGHNLQHLRALFLRENHRMTDRGISTLCSVIERRSGFEKKRRLDASINIRKLRELSLSGLHRLTSYSLAGFPIPGLRSLSLEGCVGLDDSAMQDLSRSSSAATLVSLNLMYCHKISDRAVQTIATHVRGLQHLNLCYLYRITDDALESIAQNLHQLRSLDVSHCAKITSAVGLSSCINGLRRLSELKIRSCRQFDEGTIERIASLLEETMKDGSPLSLSLVDARDTRMRNYLIPLESLQRLDPRFVESGGGCFVRL